MLNMNRRGFLKATTAMGVGATLFNVLPNKLVAFAEAKESQKDIETKVRSICRGCGKYECGVWVHMKNGRPVKIVGDHDSHSSFGNCCSKGQASIQTCFHPDRLLYPMKRTKPKGQEAGWVRISWDEALSTTAKKFLEIKEKYGANAIRLHHGTSRITSYAVQMVVQGLGSSNIGMTAGQVCKGPRYWASAVTFFRGGGYVTFNDDTQCLVQWGGQTEISNYDNSSAGTLRARSLAKKHIIVGPRLQNMGSQADIWLPLRPGTDGAMAMAWIKIIIDNKKYDKDFITEWSNSSFLYSDEIEPSGFVWRYRQGMLSEDGIEPLDIRTKLVKESDIIKNGSTRKFAYYDKKTKKISFFDAEKASWGKAFKNVDPALEGVFNIKLANGKTVKAKPVFEKLKDSVKKYTPEYAGKICQVDPKLIKEAALTYSSFRKGGGISVENGLEHAGNCIQSIRSVYLLSCLTGNIDNKSGHRGGDDSLTNWVKTIPYNAGPAIADPTPAQRKLTPGADIIPLLPWGLTMYSAPAIGDMGSITKMTLTGKPYPIKAIMGMTGSFTQNANATENYKAYKAIEFNCTAEIFMTPTAELADIVLPSAHWLENEVIRVSQGAGGVLGMQSAPVKLQGEARPDQVICIELLKKMKIPYWPKEWGTQWPTLAEMNEKSIEPLKKDIGVKDWQGFREKFQKEGALNYKDISPKEWGSYDRYKNGLFRHDKLPGFPTPTTRIEILSTILESYHMGDELPLFREPPLSAFTKDGKALRKKGYNITLLTGVRSPVYFHSETRMVPYCRELHVVPRVQINPEFAEEIGVKQGDWVWIENHKGKVRMTADIFHGIAPDVASADHAWYYPELPGPDHGWQYSNVNVLVDDKYKDPIIGANLLKTYPVKIYKAKEGAPKGIISSPTDPRLKKWLPKFPEERS